MRSLYRYSRRQLGGMAPRSHLGQFTLYLLVVALALYLIRAVMVWLDPAPTTGTTISGWLSLLFFIIGALSLVLLYRWLKRTLLWRLRNRLIVTYIFIGVVPLVLVSAMATLAAYIFAGQFAMFLTTADIRGELRSLEASNAAIASEISHHLRGGGAAASASVPALESFAAADNRFSRITVTASFRDRAMVLQPGVAGAGPPSPNPEWVKAGFSGIVSDGQGLFLRVVTPSPVGKENVVVVSSLPFDRELVDQVASSLGRITITPLLSASESEPVEAAPDPPRGLRFRAQRQRGSGVNIQTDSAVDLSAVEPLSGGTVPPERGFWDSALPFGGFLNVRRWSDGEEAQVLLTATTRASSLYDRLFAALGGWATAAVYFLVGIAIVFAVIEFIALLFGIGLTRTITGSVAKLYDATQRINRGDLRHRIQVTSNDQLAALEMSFNSMSDSLQRLIAEQKEKERLQSELAIAHEVQAQLFPKENVQLPTLEIHGLCLPARTVSGDYYDFLPFGEGRLGLAVGDISGKGISAALLMATLHSAVRAYALENVGAFVGHAVAAGGGNGGRPKNGNGLAGGMDSPAALLALLNKHLYFTTSSEKYATLFLAVYDDHSRTFTYSNAGHLAPIVISPDGSLRRLDQGGMVIGLFDNITHDEHAMHLRPGELFVAFSDGITEPENEFGEFGEARLIDIVHAHRDQPLARVSDAVIAAVQDWVGPSEQPDDLTLVLARGR